jgi:hypothetical protein
MPAQAENRDAIVTLQARFNAIGEKLMMADGVISAVLSSFEGDNDESLLPGPRMQAALLAATDLIDEARELAGQTT